MRGQIKDSQSGRKAEVRPRRAALAADKDATGHQPEHSMSTLQGLHYLNRPKSCVDGSRIVYVSSCRQRLNWVPFRYSFLREAQ